MPIQPFKFLPKNLVEWGRYFRSVEVIPDPNSVGEGQLKDGAVTHPKLQNSAALSVLGRASDTAGAPADIAASTEGLYVGRRGDAVAFQQIKNTEVFTDRTDAEISAGVIPDDYSYEPGHIDRMTSISDAVAVGHVHGNGSQLNTVTRSAAGNLVSTLNRDDIRISGLTFDMQFGTHGSGHGASIGGGSRHVFRDVTVEDFGDAGSGAGTGLLFYQGAAKPRLLRLDACQIEANTAATVSVGWIFADVDTSFATHIYVKNVQDGIGYAHELKNDARHNLLSGLIAESCNWALAYGQDTVGTDGADYNLAQGIVAKACDGGFIAGEAVGNIVNGLLHDAASSPGSGTKRTIDLQSSSTQNLIANVAAHGNVAGPVRIDGDENYVEIADFSSASETVRFQSGAQRNGVHITHPGTRNTIRSRIVDSSGSGIRGTDCNVVYSPVTGEWIGSVSGSMLWALGTPGATYTSTHYYRYESDDHVVLALSTPGNNGDVVGLNYTIPGTAQHASFMYGKQTTASNEYWKVRVNNVDVLRFFGSTARPETDDSYDLGTSLVRFKAGYVKQVRPGDGTPIWTSGSGTPEGAVTAVVGSLYTRTDGGAGTTLYCKESGSGNTGWVAK